jgi:hypothetical protein
MLEMTKTTMNDSSFLLGSSRIETREKHQFASKSIQEFPPRQHSIGQRLDSTCGGQSTYNQIPSFREDPVNISIQQANQ